MLNLHGIAVSNYYNMVKHTLLEKALPFEEVFSPPAADAQYLQRSPMGKVPFLQTNHGYLSETFAIFEYLEQTYPAPPLYPADAFARAKARELMYMVELYIELPARRNIGEALFDEARSESAHAEARPALERGLAAFRRVARFEPFVAGDAFGYADIFTFHAFDIAAEICRNVYAWNIVEAVPGLAGYLEMIGDRPHTADILARARRVRRIIRANRRRPST
ncbi:MAG: glutathione S-transferase [Gammaproteobacteria bacterium]|nr:glutathione S-transferase [Gammaproteobacteria bacterium]